MNDRICSDIDLGFTLDAKKLEKRFNMARNNKKCLKDLILGGCIAWRKEPEGIAEPVRWENLSEYSILRFDPQYLLFPSSEDKIVQPDVVAEEWTTVQSQPIFKEDAKLIYWATPELQQLFLKSLRYTTRHGKYDLSKSSGYCDAMQRTLADFRDRLMKKTDKIQLESAINFEGSPEMKSALKKVYDWYTADIDNDAESHLPENASPKSIEVTDDDKRLTN